MKYKLPKGWIKDPQEILSTFVKQKWRLALAESCTGGLVTAVLIGAAGASEVLERSWVTYSNQSKIEELGVDATLIEQKGAVSQEVAEAMSAQARTRAGVEIGMAITGIAGPTGGTDEKPKGLVFIALTDAEGISHHRRYLFSGDRQEIRARTVAAALAWLHEWAS
ncbi:MAG: CinA family protein [Bacteroidetes bacterium]|nr:MAG: CinA family protein [Bacteroidota bacterium]